MLEKNFNFYVVDDVFDNKFACDFNVQHLKEKYTNHIAGLDFIEHNVFGNWGNEELYMNDGYFDTAKSISVAQMYWNFRNKYENETLQERKNEHIEQLLSTFEEFEHICERMENLIEEDYDDEYNLHDRSIDYNYDYENDCEYDSEEEIFECDN